MSDQSKIEWCDSTFNPWIGCTKVGPGCDHCYAEADFDLRKHRVKWGAGNPRSRTSTANWKKPLQWDRQHAEFFAQHGRRRRVFCASLADVFDNEVPREWRLDLIRLISSTPHLDWLLLTKRIGNAADMLEDVCASWPTDPFANVSIGSTICNQAEADRDIPKLLRTPAAAWFLSIEPMLEQLRIDDIPDGRAGGVIKPLCGLHWTPTSRGMTVRSGEFGKIGWVIVGGESGPHARPMHPVWVRSIRDQCAAAGVPMLFKQWGEWAPGESIATWPRQAQGATLIDGRWVTAPSDLSEDAHRDDEPDLYRVGKKAAGRLLDGVTHDGYPQQKGPTP